MASMVEGKKVKEWIEKKGDARQLVSSNTNQESLSAW